MVELPLGREPLARVLRPGAREHAVERGPRPAREQHRGVDALHGREPRGERRVRRAGTHHARQRRVQAHPATGERDHQRVLPGMLRRQRVAVARDALVAGDQHDERLDAAGHAGVRDAGGDVALAAAGHGVPARGLHGLGGVAAEPAIALDLGWQQRVAERGERCAAVGQRILVPRPRHRLEREVVELLVDDPPHLVVRGEQERVAHNRLFAVGREIDRQAAR